MCVVCGCGTGHSHDKTEAPATDSDVRVDATGDLHYGTGQARVSVPGMSQARAIRLEADVRQ